MNVFCMRSMASGGAFHRAYPHATQQAFLEAHELAFRFFGGVFGVLRYDNLRGALLQTSDLDGRIPSLFVALTSSRLEVERFPDERYGFGERRGANSECSFYDARLASDVAREIEDRRLALA